MESKKHHLRHHFVIVLIAFILLKTHKNYDDFFSIIIIFKTIGKFYELLLSLKFGLLRANSIYVE